MSSVPAVSIVVPTHNRGARLQPTLDALARQDWPPEAMEAILVADGCTDATSDVVARWRPPFAVRLVQQPASGPAAARNRGAAEARGRYLIFLDDDIHAAVGLVRAHIDAHARGADVAIGYLPVQVAGGDFFSIALRGWWDAMFQTMWKPGHRFTFRDLLSGNFSIERGLFEAAGGFETGLRCHEDYELGLRLLATGACITFAPAAIGIHDERTTLASSLKRKFDEGRADVWLLSRHPELVDELPLSYMTADSRRRRLFRWLAFAAPGVGDALAGLLARRLRWYEHLRLRFRWRALLEDLFFYWYWKGIVSAGGPPDLDAMRGLLASHRAERLPDLDLAQGLAAAERWLDRMRPEGVSLRYGPRPIADVPARAGAERLRGDHLRALLAEPLIEPYTRALAQAGDLPSVVNVPRLLTELRAPTAGVPVPEVRTAS